MRGTTAVAAVSALVAALVSVATTLLVVRLDRPGQDGPPHRDPVAQGRAAADLSALFSSVASGVVRIETTACNQGSVGSGFLVSPDQVATVAHVVAGAHKIVLTAGGTSVPGTVVGLDAGSELALIRTDRPLNGHVFSLADRPPSVGSEVVGLGYPLGGGLSLVHGIVSALDRSLTVGQSSGAQAGVPAESGAGTSPAAAGPSPSVVAHLLQVDGVFTGGDSGGPLVAADGSVVGLVEARATQAQGIGFAVGAPAARAAFDRWRANPRPVQVSGDCAAPVGPPGAVAQVSDVSGSADGPAVQSLLARFATSLNAGRYADAFDLFSPASRRHTTLAQWTAQERSSRLFDLVVHQVIPVTAAGTSAPATPAPGTSVPATPDAGAAAAAGTAGATSSPPASAAASTLLVSPTTAPPSAGQGRLLQAEITFTSVQDAALGAHGQVCSLWHLTYLFVWSSGGWRIDRATPQPGSPQAC
ncbi:MAG TPA: trypsin-like peptidase domain-containing protein [Kineosporiaceae bacterium]|nr:trypsin-like peptidase domain-containing protein [Kineosporiaceae bacterium]